MKFVWEKIWSKEQEKVFYCGTYRAKVHGGWVVRNWDLTMHPYDGAANNNHTVSESMVFIPDPNHNWKIEK